MNNEATAELRVVPSREAALEPVPEGAPPPLATARKAVPFLWLGLFDFAEAEVRTGESGDVFFALTRVASALARAEALVDLLPEEPALAPAAKLLARELRDQPAEQFLLLHPGEIFASLRPELVRVYLKRLFGVCEIWERIRDGLAWPEASRLFDQIGPELGNALQQKELLSYYLLGTLAERHDPLEDARVSEGQGKDDQDPEALAAGEQGLLLGRFGGRWKLMSSGTDQDLKDIWGEPGNVLLVGRGGTVVRLRKGVCARMESGTTAHLHCLWGPNPRFVCAAGDDGTLIVFQGKVWQPWPLPTRATLLCLGGSGPEICVGVQDMTVLRWDGRTWSRTQLPDQAMASAIWGRDGQIFAAGGSRDGGGLYSLRRGVWERDPSLPRTDWLEMAWTGWNDELGLVAASGPLLLRRDGCWHAEELPAERITDVASGTLLLAVGQIGRYGAIWRRDDEGRWQLEATVPELRLSTVWVVGRPKPPRLAVEPQKEASAASPAGR